jgi:prepilin-type N-terminal cleavage/methylation domain-containing protein
MNNFNKKIKKNGGFTYVELIVVLSIFAIMTSIVIFNYGAYQANVDIKVMANDIALKIVQAQKDAVNGVTNDLSFTSGKPSYGVYFPPYSISSKDFYFFADLDGNHLYTNSSCNNPTPDACLADVKITEGGDYISSILNCGSTCGGSHSSPQQLSDLAITFTRPESEAVFYSSSIPVIVNDHIEIVVQSPTSSSSTGCIDIYPSGRIQLSCS